MTSFRSILKRVGKIIRASIPEQTTTAQTESARPGLSQPRQDSKPRPTSPGRGTGGGLRADGGPGQDFTGVVDSEYSPSLDGDPDPGEIVWTWVPYEEDASKGKDRPVVLVGHDGPWLLALIVSSTDRANNPDYIAPDARNWIDIGTGAWDQKGRPSEVRLDRVLRIDPNAVRREGAVVPQRVFREIIEKMTSVRGSRGR